MSIHNMFLQRNKKNVHLILLIWCYSYRFRFFASICITSFWLNLSFIQILCIDCFGEVNPSTHTKVIWRKLKFNIKFNP